VQYLLFDGTGELVRKGDAERSATGSMAIRLTPVEWPLGTGANSLEVAVTSRRVALPAFASHAFATVPSWEVGAASAGRAQGGAWRPPTSGEQPRGYWRDFRRMALFTVKRVFALFLTVLVGVYLTILIANMGGQVDELRLVQIRTTAPSRCGRIRPSST
jgi:hypothetical protein